MEEDVPPANMPSNHVMSSPTLNHHHGNSTTAIPAILRFVISPQQATDLTVTNDHTFHEILDVLDEYMQSHGAGKPTAFEYDDEDGDRVTVRSNEELRAMLEWHRWNNQNTANGLRIVPLNIYPRVARTFAERNSTLMVDIESPPVSHPSSRQSSGSGSGGGSTGRKKPNSIQGILSSGQIYQHDIRMLNILGHGNGGTVHKGFHVPKQRYMAVKVIPLDISEEIQRQILSELSILFQCNSQHIIGFHGAFFMENKISMCMEFMDGGSLDFYGKIPQNVLGRIAVAVVKGLHYLWDIKIIHRDVKPSNMLVSSNGMVKICDFGVSIQLVNSIAKTYVGTNAYMAPERIRGEEYGIHSDVWSLGLSLVEMSTGTFPYAPSSKSNTLEILPPIELLQLIVNENPPQLSTDLFGDALRHFVDICLQKNPKLRPPPDQLARHPFISQNDTENQNIIVKEFICEFHRLTNAS